MRSSFFKTLAYLSFSMILFYSAAGADVSEDEDSHFSYENLIGLIQNNNVNSVESLLPLLPKSLRSNYTLMYQSRSLQEASYSSPRAILFGTDARLTCAFNGDSAQVGYDCLECFQFRDKDGSFDFRQIQFPSAQNQLKEVLFSKRNQSADGKTSCTTCHSADPRPNWDSYNNWPGVYGGHADIIEQPGSYTAGEDQEFEEYQKFIKLRDSHPRYRWLLQERKGVDEDTYEPVAAPYAYKYNYIRDYGTRGDDPRDVADNEPNANFSDYTNALTALRDVRMLNRLSLQMRYAFAVATMGCPLNASQSQVLDKSGYKYDPKTTIQSTLTQLGISPNDWSTQILMILSRTTLAPVAVATHLKTILLELVF